jgi:cytochrome c5
MRTKTIVYAVLFSLGCIVPAWASSHVQGVSPVPETAAPSLSEPRQKPVTPPVPPRGQLLYENHCMSCHESVVHVRTRQQARSLAELQARVSHWAAFLHLSWGKPEIDDVVRHLDHQYYRFESR